MTDSVMRRARFLVIEALYESETSAHPAAAAYDRRLREIAGEDDQLANSSAAHFGRSALEGVLAWQPEIDRYIAEAAIQFPLDTMAVVDRNILRLAIWELLSDPAAPVAAVVNEAVELAHRYGGGSSPAFVNGVLRTVSQRIRENRANSPPGEAETPGSNQE